MKTYSQFDVIVVPFPFTDIPKTKKRPALVISHSKEFSNNGYCVCAMITSEKNSPWPLDIVINDLKSTGLPVPSRVRMKIFTIDTKLIEKKIGTLKNKDKQLAEENLNKLFGL